MSTVVKSWNSYNASTVPDIEGKKAEKKRQIRKKRIEEEEKRRQRGQEKENEKERLEGAERKRNEIEMLEEMKIVTNARRSLEEEKRKQEEKERQQEMAVKTAEADKPLGMEDRSISDVCITASSHTEDAPPRYSRLNNGYAWCAANLDEKTPKKDSFLQIDLGSLHRLCAVATQGNGAGNQDYVKSYKLQHSKDGFNWTTVYDENENDKIFEGNTDNWTVKKEELEQEVITRFVRFYPIEWYYWPCLSVELYGAALNEFDENEPELRPFPSWYGRVHMGNIPPKDLRLPDNPNPIWDPEIDRLLKIESKDLQFWKRVKKSGELEKYTRPGLEGGSPPIKKAVMVLKDVPYRDAIDAITERNECAIWGNAFEKVTIVDQMRDFKVIKFSQNKKNRCVVLTSLDRGKEDIYNAWAWKQFSHPKVLEKVPKVADMRLETEICGAIVRPYHDATKSCKITIITQVCGAVQSFLKNTYLSGNPSKWLMWLKKHHSSKMKGSKEKEDNEKQNEEVSFASSITDVNQE